MIRTQAVYLALELNIKPSGTTVIICLSSLTKQYLPTLIHELLNDNAVSVKQFARIMPTGYMEMSDVGGVFTSPTSEQILGQLPPLELII